MALEFSVSEVVSVLERTPVVLRALLTGVPDRWSRGNEGPETWSAFDVVGHLIDGEETDWVPRAKIILERGANRSFEPFDRFRHLARNRERVLQELLDEFARLRSANVAWLLELDPTPDQLNLEGEHPEFGSVLLTELLSTWAVHDLGHLAQISRVMAKQYGDEAGPWKSYLPVLRPR